MHPVYLGTCGWSYKDWSGNFYPAGLKPPDYLAYYAHQFPVVEVDSTFYAAPSRKTVEGWRDKTPEGFGFSLKVPQAVTHEKVLEDCDAEVEAFVSVARLLGGKLRCCVLQFGYLNKSKFADLGDFLDRIGPFLNTWPADVPVAVEVRNRAWMTARLADCLRAHNAVWVLPDQAWMPEPLDVVGRLDAVTGPFAYVRLLGDREEVDRRTKALNRVVVDRDEQLVRDAEAIRMLAGRVPVLAYVNNHFEGYAIETMRRLREALRQLGAVEQGIT